MRRRDFISLGSGAALWPVVARAQPSATPHIIGFLGPTPAAIAATWFAAFVTRLGELGWKDGRDIEIEARWAEGQAGRLPQLAVDLVKLEPDVIVTWATVPALVVKHTTATIPVVFALAADPIGAGLVASLARPGGNLTGLSIQNVDLAGKRFELLYDIVPNLHRLAIMANVDAPDVIAEMKQVEATANKIGLETITLEVRHTEDIAPAFDTLTARPDAIYVVGDPLTFTNRGQINSLALRSHLPTLYAIREFVNAGGLMSYGANFPDLFRRAADFTDKILRGTKPAEIPVEQPTKFDLVINRKTAKALGLTIPQTLLATADEVIE